MFFPYSTRSLYNAFMWTVSVKAGQSELNETRVINEQTKERTNTSRNLLKYKYIYLHDTKLCSAYRSAYFAVLDAALAAHVRLPRVGAGPAAVTRSARRPVVEDTTATYLALLGVHLQRVTATTTTAMRRVSEVLQATATVVRR